MHVEMIDFLRLGTPALVLGMIVMLERIDSKIRALSEDVQELKAVITRQDTCAARHEEINRRFVHIEREISGGE